MTISARRIASTFITGWLTTGSAWHALTCRNTCPQGTRRRSGPVIAASGWFAARPSGTEDIYKIYAESFRGDDHLRGILSAAKVIVDAALATA